MSDEAMRPGEYEKLASIRVGYLDTLLELAYAGKGVGDLEADDALLIAEVLKARREAVR